MNWRFSTFQLLYLRNGARWDIRLLLITNRKSRMHTLVSKSTTLTINWLWTVIMRSLTLHTWILEPITKMNEDRHTKICSRGILLSSEIRIMRIFAGVRWRGDVKLACKPQPFLANSSRFGAKPSPADSHWLSRRKKLQAITSRKTRQPLVFY